MTATQTYPAAGSGGAPRFEPRPRPAHEPRPADDGWAGVEPRPTRVAPAAPVAAPRHLRLVDPREARRRVVTRAVTALLVAGVCAGLFAIVVLRVVLAQGQVQVDRLQASVDARAATQRQLSLQVAQLEAPAQIVAAARSRLGMVTPPSVTYLTPPPAAPATAR